MDYYAIIVFTGNQYETTEKQKNDRTRRPSYSWPYGILYFAYTDTLGGSLVGRCLGNGKGTIANHDGNILPFHAGNQRYPMDS